MANSGHMIQRGYTRNPTSIGFRNISLEGILCLLGRTDPSYWVLSCVFLFFLYFWLHYSSCSVDIENKALRTCGWQNQLEKIEAAKAAKLVLLDPSESFWVNFYWPYHALLVLAGTYFAFV